MEAIISSTGFQSEYSLLRSLAHRYSGLSATPTLSPTVLVHEAWLRLSNHGGDYADRGHFISTAAAAMRQVMVDYARAQRRIKRGGEWLRVTMRADEIVSDQKLVDVLAIHDALTELAQWDERQEKIVELRFFAGLSVEETAAAMGISERTVKREWAMARAWLQRKLAV